MGIQTLAISISLAFTPLGPGGAIVVAGAGFTRVEIVNRNCTSKCLDKYKEEIEYCKNCYFE